MEYLLHTAARSCPTQLTDYQLDRPNALEVMWCETEQSSLAGLQTVGVLGRVRPRMLV